MAFNRVWTAEEEAFLRDNIAQLSIAQLCEALGRSRSAVHSHTLKLGLRPKKNSYQRWTKRDLHTLYVLSERLTAPLIAEKMGRSVASVKSKMVDEGVRSLNDSMSMKKMARETGYAVYQLRRAIKALRMQLPKVRLRTNGQFVIGPDAYDRIVDYLKNEKKYEPSVEEKFFARVTKTSGCWHWEGKYTFYDMRTNREHRPARMAWMLLKGKLRYEERIYPKCKNRRCCNPDHYWVGVVGGANMSPKTRRMTLEATSSQVA